MPCRSTAVTIVSCLNMLWYMCSAMRIDTEVASSLITARSGEDSAAILENATAEESAALTTPAQILCRDLHKLSKHNLRAKSDELNAWTIVEISCREEKKMMGMMNSKYHFSMTMRSSKYGSKLYFSSMVSKGEEFMKSATKFKIPIGSITVGSILGREMRHHETVQRSFADVFGITIDSFYDYSYLLVGTMSEISGERPTIGMRPTRTMGYAMKQVPGSGFCSFRGTVNGQLMKINSLIYFKKRSGVADLDMCKTACEAHMWPTQICLAATYSPTKKWCELATRNFVIDLLHGQGSNQDVVNKVEASVTREEREHIKIAHLVQLQEIKRIHECRYCKCYVKDFETQKLVSPETVLFEKPP
mmetsp:Transcript_24953/g.39549  ORF Transcript_24953/g.39549 Transcript_24953/m.39549 type:complete len:361 (-) Transcript_24953:17-1099(-)